MQPRLLALTAFLALTATAHDGIAQLPYDGIFAFTGFASLPDAVGQPVVVRAVLTDPGALYPSALALDFINQQHTLVIQGVLASSAPDRHMYGNVVVALYSELIAGGTGADYSNPGSFVDGDCILLGGFLWLVRVVYAAQPNAFINGWQAWTGGSRVGELPVSPPVDTVAWGDATQPGIPAGYDEAWSGHFLPSIAIVPTTWSAVKVLFH